VGADRFLFRPVPARRRLPWASCQPRSQPATSVGPVSSPEDERPGDGRRRAVLHSCRRRAAATNETAAGPFIGARPPAREATRTRVIAGLVITMDRRIRGHLCPGFPGRGSKRGTRHAGRAQAVLRTTVHGWTDRAVPAFGGGAWTSRPTRRVPHWAPTCGPAPQPDRSQARARMPERTRSATASTRGRHPWRDVVLCEHCCPRKLTGSCWGPGGRPGTALLSRGCPASKPRGARSGSCPPLVRPPRAGRIITARRGPTVYRTLVGVCWRA
jgi:hypothetical protein